MTSPQRSPIRDPENPIPPPSTREKTSSRPQTPSRRDGPAFSPLRSPIRQAGNSIPQRRPAPDKPAPYPPVIAIANRLNRDDAPAVAKVVGDGGSSGGEAGGSGFGLGVIPGERGFVAAPGSMRRPGVGRAALALRAAAAALCMISFSVMAADKTGGWAGDSFDRYREYRYLVTVNVIAFVYSGFHVYERIHCMITTKYIIGRPSRYYFKLTMDQILAYLLMSASSAAASRNDSWVSRFGSDDFMDRANGSIAISFLAFIVLALSSLISAYNLFRWSPP